MKLNILFFILFISSQLFSQNKYFNARMGITSMGVTESYKDISASYDHIINAAIGFGFELPLSRNFSIQPEFLMIGKGFNMDDYNKVNFAYFEIPILLKGIIPIEESFELFAEAGPSISLGFGGTAVVNGVSYKGVFGNNGYNSFDYGLQYSAGFNVKLENENKIGAGIRFYNGLANLYPTNPNNVEGRNNGFHVTISYSKLIDN